MIDRYFGAGVTVAGLSSGSVRSWENESVKSQSILRAKIILTNEEGSLFLDNSTVDDFRGELGIARCQRRANSQLTNWLAIFFKRHQVFRRIALTNISLMMRQCFRYSGCRSLPFVPIPSLVLLNYRASQNAVPPHQSVRDRAISHMVIGHIRYTLKTPRFSGSGSVFLQHHGRPSQPRAFQPIAAAILI